MSTALLLILITAFICGFLYGIAAAIAKPRAPQVDYRRNKLAHELKWLKVGIDEVDRRLKKAKKCACNTQAAQNFESVKQYHSRAVSAVKGLDKDNILAAENELTAHQQLLANARNHLERAEHEKCDVPEDGRKGGCRE